MKRTFTHMRALSTLALLAGLASGLAAAPASAAPSAGNGADHQELVSAPEAGQVGSAQVPTLSDDLGQPSGLLGLAFGVAAHRRPPLAKLGASAPLWADELAEGSPGSP